MKLRSQLPDPERAWDAFLEFSPGSRDVLAQNEILSAGSKSPKDLLIEKGSGKYKIEWKKLGSHAGSPSKKWEALRIWQRAELVRLGFVAFATPAVFPSGVSAFSVLAEFTLQASLGLVREEAPETDQTHLGAFSVLALGKLGAGDLNFFSDLDLIFCGAEKKKEMRRLAWHGVWWERLMNEEGIPFTGLTFDYVLRGIKELWFLRLRD